MIEEIIERLDRIERIAKLNGKDILSLEEAAIYLDTTDAAMYAFNARRTISYSRAGMKCYYKKSDLDNYMLSNPKKSKSEIDSEVKETIRGFKHKIA